MIPSMQGFDVPGAQRITPQRPTSKTDRNAIIPGHAPSVMRGPSIAVIVDNDCAATGSEIKDEFDEQVDHGLGSAALCTNSKMDPGICQISQLVSSSRLPHAIFGVCKETSTETS